MKALRASTVTEIPEPKPQAGEVLVRVYAAGVTPSELVWYPTSHTRTGEPRTDAVPAHEFSGEIAALGEGVTGVSIGQEVYGMNDWFADGAMAECCITQPQWIAPKPQHLTHVEAASVPISALTAWQGLFDRAHLQPGERVLVHGGAGAVGIYAIQLARSRGARVTTTVSGHNIDFVTALGAHQAIDYRSAPFESQVREAGFDVVFDTVGGDTLRRSWDLLRPAGRMVTIAAGGETEASDARTKAAFFIVEPNQQQLREVATRLDSGELRAVVDRAVPFSQAAEAYRGTLEKQGRGKVVVMVRSQPTSATVADRY
jgi:NADPH:quinone reductase-like Zn-dependent oxidoreductase